MMDGHDEPPPDIPEAGERKIVVVGDTSCGKTCLIAAFVAECPVDLTRPVPRHIRRTVSFGRESLPVVLREEQVDPRYPFFRRVDYTGASAALVCFAFDDATSIKSVPRWIHEMSLYCPSADLSVVGCKADLSHSPAVSVDEWMALERSILPCKYFECSARTGEGVSHLVRLVGNVLMNQQRP